MPQSSKPGIEGGGRAREEGEGGGSGRAGPGRRSARRAPGAGQGRSPLARSARLSAAAAVSLSRSPSYQPAPGEPGGLLSLLQAAVRPLGATKASGSHGEASAQTPGLHALQTHGEPSSSRLRFHCSRARVSLGAGLPCIWARGLTSTHGGCGQISAHACGASSSPCPTRAWVRRPKHPQPHLYANTRRHTGTEPPAEKHVHANTYTAGAAGPVCARSGRRTGDFVKCIRQTF